jgi:transposase
VLDESIFVYDALLRKVWAVKGSKPRMLTTGSHRRTVVFGAIADNGAQLFRLYKNADSDAFLPYLRELRRKFPDMVLFMDRATYHQKEARVRRYLRANRGSIRVRWFPSGFPEANPVEECWKQGKDSILGSTFYASFEDFKSAISRYYRTKRFKLDVYKYLCS